VCNLSANKYSNRYWWDKGDKNFWVASVGGRELPFDSIVNKLTPKEFAALAEDVINAERDYRKCDSTS